MTVTATQRLIGVESKSPDFDVFLRYCVYPLGADFYRGDIVGTYDGVMVGNCVSIILADGRKAYTNAENVV